jgi:hypothetical protein
MSNRNDRSLEATTAQERDAVCLVSVLTRAQGILAEPARWTRGTFARSVLNGAVQPASDCAWSWSASGALALALLDVLGSYAAQCDRERLYDLGIRSLWHSLPDDHPRTSRMSRDIDGFNDYPGTNYRDIMQLFDRALAGARSALS